MPLIVAITWLLIIAAGLSLAAMLTLRYSPWFVANALTAYRTAVATLSEIAVADRTAEQIDELRTAQHWLAAYEWLMILRRRTLRSWSFWAGLLIAVAAWLLVRNIGWAPQYGYGPTWLYWTIWFLVIGGLTAITINRTWSFGAVVTASLLALGLILFQGNFNTEGVPVAGDGWATGEKGNCVVTTSGDVVTTTRENWSNVQLQASGDPYDYWLARWQGFNRILVHIAVGTPKNAISEERAIAFNAVVLFHERLDGMPAPEDASAYPDPWDVAKIDPENVFWPSSGWSPHRRNLQANKAQAQLKGYTNPGPPPKQP